MQFIGTSNKVSDAGKDRWAPSYKLQGELDDSNDGHDHSDDDGEQG